MKPSVTQVKLWQKIMQQIMADWDTSEHGYS